MTKEKSNKIITLGVTPSNEFQSAKGKCQILSINYSSLDCNGGFISVLLQVGSNAQIIKISEQEAIELGFINPYGLIEYCQNK